MKRNWRSERVCKSYKTEIRWPVIIFTRSLHVWQVREIGHWPSDSWGKLPDLGIETTFKTASKARKSNFYLHGGGEQGTEADMKMRIRSIRSILVGRKPIKVNCIGTLTQ